MGAGTGKARHLAARAAASGAAWSVERTGTGTGAQGARVRGRRRGQAPRLPREAEGSPDGTLRAALGVPGSGSGAWESGSKGADRAHGGGGVRRGAATTLPPEGSRREVSSPRALLFAKVGALRWSGQLLASPRLGCNSISELWVLQDPVFLVSFLGLTLE